MKKTLVAAAMLAGVSFQAEAQTQCVTRESLQESWSSISTDMVFRGLSDQGVMIEIFENIENGRWSFWFTNPSAPNVVCKFDQGSAAISQHEEFTRPQEPSP